ncbi:MAG: YitT family protein [Thermodesulfobacteriota bacterium]
MNPTQTLPAPPAHLDHRALLQSSLVWNLFLITAGSVICAWAINGILLPHEFLSGGVTGAALILHYRFPDVPVSVLYFLLNIPLYFLGWRYIGRRFFWYSVAGMLIFSAAVELVPAANPLDDRYLAALLAGLVFGSGCGLILKSVGSAGGTDILSIMLFKRYGIRLGSTVMAFNAAVMGISLFMFSLKSVLFTLIFMFVSTRVVDLVVTGFSQRKAVMIISRNWTEMVEVIKNDLNRGVTVIHGEGGFSGEPQRILYTIVTFQELGRLKRLIRQIDPNPFVVVTETMEVTGLRIGNQPHW